MVGDDSDDDDDDGDADDYVDEGGDNEDSDDVNLWGESWWLRDWVERIVKLM